MLRTSLLCQIWGSPRDYLIQMRQIVSIQNSIFKSFRKLIFSAFGTILVLVAPFFHSKLNLENIEILIFPSFWHDIGFGGSLFLFKIQCKNKFKKFVFFQLLARSWFCIFFSKKKRKNAKKIQKGYLLQTQPYPWWTLYLEPPFCIRFGRFHQDEIRDRMKKDTWCVVFSKLLTVENVIVQKKQNVQKRYLLQTQPYPCWTLYLEPPFCIRFGLFHLIRMRQEEIRDMMCCVFMTFDICKYNSTK